MIFRSPLVQHEPLDGIGDSVFLIGFCNKICDIFQFVHSIFHHYTESRCPDHKRVMKELSDLEIASVSTALFNNVEITQLGCDKGDGITQLAKHLSIPIEETMACGDAANDTSQLEIGRAHV